MPLMDKYIFKVNNKDIRAISMDNILVIDCWSEQVVLNALF